MRARTCSYLSVSACFGPAPAEVQAGVGPGTLAGLRECLVELTKIECIPLAGYAYDTDMEEIQTFRCFLTEFLEVRRWRLYRAEWTIYDEVVMVAGQIDAVFVDCSGALHMIDWKRVRHPLLPTSGEKFQRYGMSLCEHLLDNHFNHYALQQNLYSAILRRRYALHLSSMALVQIHPEVMHYHVIDVPEWRKLADDLLDASGATAKTV